MSRVRRWIIGGQAVRTFLEALFTGFILLLAWTWLGQTSPDIVYLSNFVTAVLAVILIFLIPRKLYPLTAPSWRNIFQSL